MGNEIKPNYSSYSLEERMKMAQDGNKKAYESVLKEIQPIIRNFLKKFNYRNLIDVDELSQEILIAIHKAGNTYNSSRPFKPWVYAIANFKLKDALRSIYRKNKLQEVNFADFENTLYEEFEFYQEKERSLEDLLHVLKPKQQKIVRLLKIEGNSLEETANNMNMTVAAVKISAHRSYKILINKFGPNE